MSAQTFHFQPLLNDVFTEKDLLDFGSPTTSTSTQVTASQPAGLNRISQFVSSTAAAASQRRTGRAGASSPVPFEQGESSAEKSGAKVTCSAGYGNNLFVGASDGAISWYIIEPGVTSSNGSSYTFRHRTHLATRRPISKLLLLPRLSKLLVLSESSLYTLSLTTLEVFPTNVYPVIRGVVNVAVDDMEIGWRPEEEGQGHPAVQQEMSICVIKKKLVVLYRLGAKMVWLQDIPVPETPLQLVRSGPTICLADSSNYCIIDLTGPHWTEILPISQALPPAEDDETAFRPEASIAVLPGEEEFLFCSYLGEGGSMGVFVNKGGDAVRGTISWESHPRSLVIEGSSVIAMLHDNTVVIHSLDGIQAETPADYHPQVLPFPGDLGPISLSSNPYGVMIPHHERDEKLSLVAIPLKGSPASPVVQRRGSDQMFEMSPPIASPLTTVDAFGPVGSEIASTIVSVIPPGPHTTTVAETLLVAEDSVVAIASTAWVIIADEMLTAGKVEEAKVLVEEERRKAKRGDLDGDKATHTLDLRYIYNRLAFGLLRQVKLEEASAYFFRGKLDPRLLCRIFPELVGASLGVGEEVLVPKGLQGDVGALAGIEEIIDTASHAGTVEGDRDSLVLMAKLMLQEFLRKTRAARRKSQSSKVVDKKIDVTIDTCLCKLLAENGEVDDLKAILDGPNDCLLNELEPYLRSAQQYWVLSRVLLKLGQNSKVLEVLVDIADGATPDSRAEYPENEVAGLLYQTKDPTALRKYGLWLIKKDPEIGLKIFTTQDKKTGVRFDDRALIADIKAINKDASDLYLEHVVVNRRNADRELHTALVEHLLDLCDAFLADEGVRYHFNELYQEYVSTKPLLTYAAYIAETAHDSPAKTARLKTILFLQGSPFYDLVTASERLEKSEQLFYERAIVLGRLGEHQKALKLLALVLKDAVSAETYCTQGGEVLPPKIGRAITNRMRSLEAWAALGEVGRRRKGTVGGDVREMLVMELLRVYMSEGSTTAKQTAALLNAQAVHLDAIEVLNMIPGDWPVASMAAFLGRNFKRQTNEKANWQVLKAISAGQTLAVSEEFASTVGRQTPTVELGQSVDSEGKSSPDEGSIPDKEYSSMEEKGFGFQPELRKSKEGSGKSG